MGQQVHLPSRAVVLRPAYLGFLQGVNRLLIFGPSLEVIIGAVCEGFDNLPEQPVPQEGHNILLCLNIRSQHLCVHKALLKDAVPLADFMRGSVQHASTSSRK